MQSCGPAIPPRCAATSSPRSLPSPSDGGRPRRHSQPEPRVWRARTTRAPPYSARCALLKSLYHCEDDTRVPKAHGAARWRPAPHLRSVPRLERGLHGATFCAERSAAGNDARRDGRRALPRQFAQRQRLSRFSVPLASKSAASSQTGSKMGLHTTEKATPVEEVQLAPMRRADGSTSRSCNGGDQQWVADVSGGQCAAPDLGGRRATTTRALVEYEKLRLFFVFRPWEYGRWGDDGLARRSRGSASSPRGGRRFDNAAAGALAAWYGGSARAGGSSASSRARGWCARQDRRPVRERRAPRAARCDGTMGSRPREAAVLQRRRGGAGSSATGARRRRRVRRPSSVLAAQQRIVRLGLSGGAVWHGAKRRQAAARLAARAGAASITPMICSALHALWNRAAPPVQH